MDTSGLPSQQTSKQSKRNQTHTCIAPHSCTRASNSPINAASSMASASCALLAWSRLRSRARWAEWLLVVVMSVCEIVSPRSSWCMHARSGHAILPDTDGLCRGKARRHPPTFHSPTPFKSRSTNYQTNPPDEPLLHVVAHGVVEPQGLEALRLLPGERLGGVREVVVLHVLACVVRVHVPCGGRYSTLREDKDGRGRGRGNQPAPNKHNEHRTECIPPSPPAGVISPTKHMGRAGTTWPPVFAALRTHRWRSRSAAARDGARGPCLPAPSPWRRWWCPSAPSCVRGYWRGCSWCLCVLLLGQCWVGGCM